MDEKMLLQERAKIVETIITRAWADESFKAQLLENPGKALEAVFGTKLPPSISVKAVEETAETRYLVIPYRPKAGDELSNEELEAVAGGGSNSGIGRAAGEQFCKAKNAVEGFIGNVGLKQDWP